MVLSVLGCAAPSLPAAVPPPAVVATVVAADCAPDPANALRASCTVGASAPAVLEVELTDGEETVVFATEAAATEAVLPIWGLLPATTYDWVARIAGGAGLEGILVTAALPAEVALDVGFEAGTGPSTIADVLVPAWCGGSSSLVAFDAGGRVRWYQDLAAGAGVQVNAVTFTEDDTVLALVGKDTVVEFDLAGTERLRIVAPTPTFHHDVGRRDGVTYVLSGEPWLEDDGVTYVEDVVLGLDPAGAEVSRWEEHGVLDPQGSIGPPDNHWQDLYPGAIDAWHTNALFVTEEGDLVLSLHAADTVVRVSAADGALAWALAGDGLGAMLASSLAFAGPGTPAFAEQHDAVLLDDDHLTLFDNAHDRGLELALDPARGTARFVADWPLGLDCPFLGSVRTLPDDHRLLACAPAKTVEEFDASGAQVGGYHLSCPSGDTLLPTTRAVPFDPFDARAGGVVARRIRE